MAKYLVTGVAGFIANKVAQVLLDEGHSVIGVDNMNDAYDVRMKEYRLGMLKSRPGFHFYRQDIRDKEVMLAMAEEVKGFSAVINLAARAGVRASVEDPWEFVETNMTGTLNLLEVCRLAGIPKMLLASTSGLYGQNASLPTPETSGSSLPLQPYAASKKGAEVMTHAYHFLHGLDVTIVRYFNVYGPAGRPDSVMFKFIKWMVEGKPLHLFGDGNQSRGFTYIDDIARGTIQALQPLGYEIINLGGHETIKINTLISLLEEITGKQAEIVGYPFPKADIIASHADTKKAKELLGWQPQITLRQGVSEMVQWYLDNLDWVKDIDVEL